MGGLKTATATAAAVLVQPLPLQLGSYLEPKGRESLRVVEPREPSSDGCLPSWPWSLLQLRLRLLQSIISKNDGSDDNRRLPKQISTVPSPCLGQKRAFLRARAPLTTIRTLVPPAEATTASSSCCFCEESLSLFRPFINAMK